MKSINREHQTEHHISWTTEGINVLLAIANNIQWLQANKKNKAKGFVKMTLEDAQAMQGVITDKLGVSGFRRHKVWKDTFWYADVPDDHEVTNEPTSDKLELCFTQVINLYVRHQFAWDNADMVDIVDGDFYESEPDDVSSGDE